MYQIKKLSAVLLSAALSLAVLTSCGNGNTVQDGGSASDSGANAVLSAEMRDITSMELVKDMGIGWNLGDTLDVCQADRDGDGKINEHVEEGEKVDETLWGNPKATKELFTALKEDGIKSVRIPVTWRDHMDAEGNVDREWMDRVHEVVDYAYSQDMYVILNVHHDGGGDPKFGAWIIEGAKNDKENTLKRYKKLWSQITEEFKDYGDKLVFESMNEVGFDGVAENTAYNLLNEFNQAFVDLVRNSGGNNGSRHLLIAGYWTDIARTCSGSFKMPSDSAGRCIVSVHYYTPWEFCTTNIHNTWGTDAEVKQMEDLYGMMKTNFVDKGIPVIIGEYAASGNDKASCIFFIEKMVKLCSDYGMAPYYWDNGGQLDRNTYEWRTPEYLEAMKRASGGEDYEVVKQ
ncbi:MAG: glycoside hydrolase family 5 protein [Oscillospiraceae bacterium]|nr:glycoside hydrolase family 5 protein [Oscillospiraceae bacterium]